MVRHARPPVAAGLAPAGRCGGGAGRGFTLYQRGSCDRRSWPLTLRAEGLAAATGIALRFVAIFTLIVVFVGALPLSHLIGALRGLGLPALLVDMALLTLRHIEDLRHDLARMQTAMRLRGGYGWLGRFRATGWLLASLLLRSHARSERVYHAMILRGHGATGAALPDAASVPRADKWALAGLIALAASLLVVDHLA